MENIAIMRASCALGFVMLVSAVVAACGGSSDPKSNSSSTSGGSGSGGSTSGGGSGSSSGGTSIPACTVTFGADASSVMVTGCSTIGSITDSNGNTGYHFVGDITGSDAAGYDFGFTLTGAAQAKTYQTADVFSASFDLDVNATGGTYRLELDSTSPSSNLGSLVVTLTSADHGTANATLVTRDTPPKTATMTVAF